jgi:hypothetical protein
MKGWKGGVEGGRIEEGLLGCAWRIERRKVKSKNRHSQPLFLFLNLFSSSGVG